MKINNLAKILICAVLAILISAVVVGITLQAVATFEVEMLPNLIFPILIVAIPAYIFVYYSLFKKKRK